MLFIFVLGLYRGGVVTYSHMTVSLASLWSTTLRDSLAVSVQCGCAVWNPGTWQHGPVRCDSGQRDA